MKVPALTEWMMWWTSAPIDKHGQTTRNNNNSNNVINAINVSTVVTGGILYYYLNRFSV